MVGGATGLRSMATRLRERLLSDEAEEASMDDNNGTEQAETMTRDDILQLLEKAGPVGTVHHRDFIDFVVLLDKQQKVDGQWIAVQQPYMTVDGRIAMACRDHTNQGKRLDFHDPEVIETSELRLTLRVTVESKIYGRRHGIASSRLDGAGSPFERGHPWEVAETSALGRALGAMGYGLLPGAGLVSAEQLMLAAEEEPSPVRDSKEPTARAPETPPPSGDGRRPRITKKKTSRYQREQIVTMYAAVHGVEHDEARKQVEALFAQRFGHPMERASYDEGCKVIAELLPEWSKRKEGAAA